MEGREGGWKREGEGRGGRL